MYQNIVSSVFDTPSEAEPNKAAESVLRVDEYWYWSKVFDVRNAPGHLKYPTVHKIDKT